MNCVHGVDCRTKRNGFRCDVGKRKSVESLLTGRASRSSPATHVIKRVCEPWFTGVSRVEWHPLTHAAGIVRQALLTGAVLPVWQQVAQVVKRAAGGGGGNLKKTALRVVRTETDEGKRIVGLHLGQSVIDTLEARPPHTAPQLHTSPLFIST